jgi:hypothetical protein
MQTLYHTQTIFVSSIDILLFYVYTLLKEKGIFIMKKVAQLFAVLMVFVSVGVLGVGCFSRPPVHGNPGIPSNPTQLATPINVTTSANMLTWSTVPHATGYEILINGVVIPAAGNGSHSLTSLRPGLYEMRVRAISNNALYTASMWSSMVDWSNLLRLATPSNISFDNNLTSTESVTLVWAAVPNAISYSININGVFYTSNTNHMVYQFPHGEAMPASYTVSIRANANNTTFASSVWSPAVTATISGLALPRLATPTNIFFDSDLATHEAVTLVWDTVPGAMYYTISINGAIYTSSSNNLVLAFPEGRLPISYTVSVRAIAGKNYDDSAWSTQVTATIYSRPVRLAAPSGVRIEAVNGRPLMFWNAVQNANRYRVFYRSPAGQLVEVALVRDWSFDLTELEAFSTTVLPNIGLNRIGEYQFMVRAEDITNQRSPSLMSSVTNNTTVHYHKAATPRITHRHTLPAGQSPSGFNVNTSSIGITWGEDGRRPNTANSNPTMVEVMVNGVVKTVRLTASSSTVAGSYIGTPATFAELGMDRPGVYEVRIRIPNQLRTDPFNTTTRFYLASEWSNTVTFRHN